MFKVSSIFIVFFTLLQVAGCASTSSSYPNVYHDSSKSTDETILRLPNLEELSTVEVGENMYEKSYLMPKNTYSVKLLDNVLIDNGKGRQYAWLALGLVGAAIMESTADKDELSMKKGSSFMLLVWGNNGYKTICSASNNCLIDPNNLGSFTHNGVYPNGNLKKLDAPIKYKLIPTPPEFKEDSFKYAALYQGIVGNKIKISFREFYKNLARPAFSQEIDYELDQNGETMIGFKGLRIAVEKATNLDITYKVIKDYK
ncbi:hypothetical protein [Marinomonas sp. IMCC 4694]|uniref:hypothetical protein n=1 Tax=Marinomonas sp. IMCC 4694 TaxID=2605432 RepID=UPI0011E86153|nr:hypothetical protein [Marinomonas sp. IMCC 4694]TYL48556.1 hypothetical protein FXV75_11760 [Marinomonas sp. IMCC 4694]